MTEIKVPEALSKLHKAVSEMSQIDLQKACAELSDKRAINLNDAHEVAKALNAFKSFFVKIKDRREPN